MASRSGCRGRLVLRLRIADQPRRPVLGAATVALRAGRAQTVTVRLSAAGRAKLRARRPLSADVRFADRAAGRLVVLPSRRR
jgi:hypothetical protein